jgi:hypothetical protein
MKRLFDVDEQWTNDAMLIEQEITNALKPIIDKFADQQFIIRDLHYVAISSLADIIVCRALLIKEVG